VLFANANKMPPSLSGLGSAVWYLPDGFDNLRLESNIVNNFDCHQLDGSSATERDD
jgi:hypothetical protein